jgi:hypothetical protein
MDSVLNSAIFNSWFAAAVRLVSSIIAIPIVITKLNIAEINIWFLFSSIVAISQGIQFGFNTTFSRFISYVNNGVKIKEFRSLRFKLDTKFEDDIDKHELSSVFFLMKYIYIYLSIAYLFILLLIGYFALVGPIGALEIQGDGWMAATILAASTTITLSFGYYNNFMIGINKVALVQKISAVTSLIGLPFILLVLFFNPTLVSIVLVYQLIELFTLAVIIFFSKKEINKFNLKKKNNPFDNKLFSIVWESTWKSGITTIMANVVKHVSAILVAQFLTPSMSASFLFTKKIFDIIENFTMTTFQARLPMITKYRGQGDFKAFMPYVRQTQYISYGVFLVGYTLLITGGEYILGLVSSNVNLGSYILIIFFSLAAFISRWSGMTAAISNTSNHVIDYINLPIVSFIYLSIIYLFHDELGVNVFPLAALFGYLLAAPVLIFIVYKTIDITFLKYESRVGIPLFGVLLVINTIYYWSKL